MKQTREIHSYSPLSILWHPSGQAFLSYNTNTGNYELFRLADGAVVAEALEPGSFSPDGAKLAAYEGQELRIYDIRLDANGDVIGVNGKYSKYQLPLDEDIIMSSILWSPQGDRLAFSAQKSWDYPTSFIYSIKQDGSDLIKLVDSKILEPEKLIEIRSEAGTPHGAHIYYGWSPNGTKVAFLAYTFLPKEKYIVEPQVYVVDADGTELMKITGDEFFPEGDDLLWVPDGRLLFQAGNKLILSNADGSEKKALSENIYIIYAFFLPPSADEYLAGIFAKPFAFNCATGWARMEIGIEAIVAPGSPNRVRSEPKKGDNLIASLLAGTIVNIIEGPVCADGLIFWKVENELISGGVGWTAEGDGNEYWLEPIK
jgi:hypothetical protein